MAILFISIFRFLWGAVPENIKVISISKKRGSNYDYDTMVKQQLKIKEQYKVWEHTEV